MSAQIKYIQNINFHLIHSGCCDAEFMMSEGFYSQQQRLKEKGGWFCPKCGSSRCFTGKTKEDELREQLKATQRGKEFAERQAEIARNAERYQKNCARAQKAAKTKMKNRIKNGVCPCCNRTFKQLAAHMKNKHPDYAIKK